MLDKLERFVRTSSNRFADAGTVLMLVTFVLISVDIFGSKFFTFPVPGSVELIGLLQMLMIPLAAALTQIYRQHIRIEILTDRLPKPIKAVIDSIISLVLLCGFIILIWQIFRLGISIQSSGQYSITLHLPIHYFVYVMAFTLIPICSVFLLDFVHSLKGVKGE